MWACINNYLPLFDVNVIIHPCHNLNVGSANLSQHATCSYQLYDHIQWYSYGESISCVRVDFNSRLHKFNRKWFEEFCFWWYTAGNYFQCIRSASRCENKKLISFVDNKLCWYDTFQVLMVFLYTVKLTYWTAASNMSDHLVLEFVDLFNIGSTQVDDSKLP